MEWEDGDLPPNETIQLFAELVSTGMAWQLQGAYGRQAHALIEAGCIDVDGRVLVHYQEGQV